MDYKLKENMGLPMDVMPSAEELRRAELKFACIREDSVRAYYDKMMAGEDLYIKDMLDILAEELTDRAFRGQVEYEFKYAYADEHPRSPNSSRRRGEIYMDTVIKYSDGTYKTFDNYLDIMTYLHAMCEFIFDYLTGADKGYEVSSRRPRPGRQNTIDETEPTREELIRFAFANTSSREHGFTVTIKWGDEAFKEAVEQMETMAQYESYVAGVPLEDIVA